MDKEMDMWKKLDNLLSKFLFVFTTITIFVMAIIIVLQIVFRLFGDPLTWSEELARILMVWTIFLGAAYLYHMPKNGHIIVDFFVALMPPKAAQILSKITGVIVTCFIVMAFYYGCILVTQSTTVVLPATKLSLSWLYLSIPVSMAFMIIFTISHILGVYMEVENEEDSLENIIN